MTCPAKIGFSNHAYPSLTQDLLTPTSFRNWGSGNRHGINSDQFIHHRCEPQTTLGILTGSPHANLIRFPGIFASPASALPKPTNPPESIPQILYEVFKQFKDFEMTAVITLPLEKLGWDDATVKAEGSIVLKDHGRLALAEVRFNPTTRYIPVAAIPYVGGFFKKIWWFPVFGALGRVNLVHAKMNSKNRHLMARVRWIGEILPWVGPRDQDVHGMLTKGVSLKTLTGPGYDLRKGLPLYPWQLADFAEKYLKEQGTKQIEKVASDFPKIVPRPDLAYLYARVDFSNRSLSYGGFKVEFAKLPRGVKNRATLSGTLLEPVVKLNGMKTFEAKIGKTTFRLENTGNHINPLVVHFKKSKRGYIPSGIEIKRYESERVALEVIPDQGPPVKFELKKGIKIHGLSITQDHMGFKLAIKNLAADQVVFNGYGADVKTDPKSRFLFKNMNFRIINGEPYFSTELKGAMTGSVAYTKEGRKVADVLVGKLQSRGKVLVKPGLISVTGDLIGMFPEIRLLVESQDFAAKVDVLVKNGTIKGNSRIEIRPKLGELEVSNVGKKPVVLNGKSGRVILRQDPSQVEKWPELKKELGAKLAAKVVTKVNLDVENIHFEVERMKMKNFRFGEVEDNNGVSPAAQITEARIKNIRIKAKEMFGRMFIRLAGFYRVIDIPKDKPMKKAEMTVGKLVDLTDSKGNRSIDFEDINIAAVADKPTPSKRCGQFIQHIHAKLGRFGFDPITRELTIEKPDDHFHIDLNNPLMGGCFQVTSVPKKYPKGGITPAKPKPGPAMPNHPHPHGDHK